MADTTLSPTGIVKPEVGAAGSTWGTTTNADWDIINGWFSTGPVLKVANGGTGRATAPRGHLAGLTLSAAGATATFGIAVGEATDTTQAAIMALASAYTKTTSSWAVGTATGSLDTGAIANSTWYHVWLIQRPDTGVVDVLTSLSATAPTMPTNYTLKRRIGSMKTNGSAQWLKFVQVGDEFLWDAAVADVAVSNLGTSATSYTLSVPTGVKVNALFNAVGGNSGTTVFLLINSLDEAAAAVTNANASMYAPAAAVTGVLGRANVRTNTSAQIRAVAGAASSSLNVATYGWLDRRGQDD